jgi:superfamily II DNA or RNA helicase
MFVLVLKWNAILIIKTLYKPYSGGTFHNSTKRMGFYFLIMITLHPHQQNLKEQILFKLPTVDRLCVTLSTGGGKTIIFTDLTKELNDYTLILVDSEDLVTQTFKTFKRMGLDVATFESKNKIFPVNKIVVSMVQTLYNRVIKKPKLIEHFKYLIVDECHIWSFNKLFEFLPNAKVIGFTATPVRLKRLKYFKCNECDKEEPFYKTEHPQNCCGYEMKAWSKDETMSEVYQDIVVGVGIDFLIDNNYLVDEELYTIEVDNSKLVTDESGEFTSKSVDAVYNNEEIQFDIIHNYKEHCEGKKTMIFTANTKINLAIFELFKSNGYENVKIYDSVNASKKNRKPIIQWFENTDDAILLNVSCFTKGFDVSDVEAIILARPTASLSLFIQIAGRGARTTKKKFKDKFIFIDGGGNADRFGMWSDPSRDWESIFWEGLNKPKQLKPILDDINECYECGFLKMKSEKVCPNCGHEEAPRAVMEKSFEVSENKQTAVLKKVVYPNGDKIVKYCREVNQDINFAFKILINQVVDLFIKNNVTQGMYLKSLKNGELEKKLTKITAPSFIKIIHSDLISKSNRTLTYIKTKIKTKLNERYKIQ